VVVQSTDSLLAADNMTSFYLVYPALAQRIEFLRHLGIQSSSPTCVIGDRGSGKSALLTYLRQDLLEHGAVVISMEAMAGIKHKQLLARLGKELEPYSQHQVIKSPQLVQKNIVHLSTQPGGLYLLFDDADALPLTVIEFLFRCYVKAKNQDGKLAMFLFCGPVIKQRLERSEAGAIKSLPAQFVHIPRLNRDDLPEFLKMWAQAHGAVLESLSDGRVTDAIYRESGALPGAIIECLPRILNRANPGRASVTTALSNHTRNKLVAAALLAVAGGVLLIPTMHRSSMTVNPAPETNPVSIIRPIPAVAKTPVVTDTADQPLREPETNTLSSAQDQAAPERQSLGAVETSTAAGNLKGDVWLQGQNPKNFTIQLLATSRERNLLEAARSYTDLQPLAVIRSERQGQAWFILVVGTYASYVEANRALQDLPEELQRSKPWIRSVSSLQAIVAPLRD